METPGASHQQSWGRCRRPSATASRASGTRPSHDVNANLYLTHINNGEDPIPICHGMFLGFVHPAGEVHIQDSGKWAACPGQDNPSTQCIVGDAPEVYDGDLSDHDGPYNGVTMGCSS
ncbi:hypothetical protein HYDPIDRAFT_27401 [Hydnomerulius pinastri MD-312]|nr:hypothetical protein HYDPIDRAFT_27401 [Hydnomerulius pinastri MD-312]